jgi:alkyl hydroperoxide reductase subunit F
MTSQPGIFAAGDVTNTPYKQIIIAAAHGANAIIAIYDHLAMMENKS